jgi:adenosylhomocysteine nucleosidase
MVLGARVRASSMKKIAIIAALPGELKPLVRGWEQRGKNAWVGRIGECDAVAVAGGIGASAVEREAERVFAGGNLDALVSYGWAGALTCAVKPPLACAISEVIDAQHGAQFATKLAKGYRLITLDHVARADEKRGLAEKYQSVLVDMEAAAVARIAAERNVPFYCFKGISDGYTDQIPDFSQFIDSEGQLQMATLLAHVALRPKYWTSMQRLGQNSSEAARGLAEMVRKSLPQLLSIF